MRKFLLLALSLLPLAASAQTVADFETPQLPKSDTFYMHYDMPRRDIGFSSGLAYFPLFTDSASGFAYWDHGFAYSNMTDSISGGLGNQFSARPGHGVNGSAQYAVAYGSENKIKLTGTAAGKGLQGMYVTNNSYTWNSIKYGDAFSRKFGDTTGTGLHIPQGTVPDYYRMVVQAFRGGVLKPDTVSFYLADYRSTDPTKDYIVQDWRWVPLSKLGAVDSLQITLESSDTASFGGISYVNTPLYYCIDNFTTNETVGVAAAQQIIARVYPNPASKLLHVSCVAGGVRSLQIFDMSGKLLIEQSIQSAEAAVDLSLLPAAQYLLQIRGDGNQIATQIFSKQ